MPSTAPAISLGKTVALIAADIKLSHSIFALPFALLASFMAGPGPQSDAAAWRTFGLQLLIIIACMVAARTWAMLFNRLVDRRFDAENARTRRRIFASGALSPRTGWVAASLAAATFMLLAALFLFFTNPWPLLLSPLVLIFIAFYSLTKRFTALCHLFLGAALAISPLAAALAINPAILNPARAPALFCISAFVLLWVAGFDVIYALADQDFDRARGLSSIPARLGTTGAIWASRLLHLAALIALIFAWKSDPRFGPIFAVALILVAALLTLEHTIVAKRGKAGLDMAFFTVNGIVSCLVGTLGIADLLLA